MLLKKLMVLAFSLSQLITPSALPPQAAVGADERTSAWQSADLARRLEIVEKAIEEKRKERSVPGMALAIVRDDKVIYLHGFGVRDIESDKPVTPDTVFSIGSATKSFTAMAAVMSQDDGKLKLDDSPKKYLPYFKMRDPDMDARVTIRDLLSHRTGLARADIAFLTGKLTRDEVIKVNSGAKPMAKLRESFQYNNVMFAAAGQVVGRAQHSAWDDFIAGRIFAPLGMKSSSLTLSAKDRAPDSASGYELDDKTKRSIRMQAADLDPIAPAGSINSTARDMAEWLRLMIAGGVWNGKRLVSEKGYQELLTSQINIVPGFDYGLGWYLDDWKGHRSIFHGGNIAGFSTQVAFLSDEKLGFVLLTNQDRAGPTLQAALETIYSNLVETPSVNPATINDAKPDSPAAISTESYASLFGSYESATTRGPVEIAAKDGKLVWINAQKQATALTEASKDHFTFVGNARVSLEAIREADGKINRLWLRQPSGEFQFDRVGSFTPPFSVEDLLARVINARGGEAQIRKHQTLVKKVAIDYETQGISGEMVVYGKAPNLHSNHTIWKALGKQIGTTDEYFDGKSYVGESSYGNRKRVTLSPDDSPYIDDERINGSFYGLADWKALFSSVEIKQKAKMGAEDALIIVATPPKGTKLAYWISTKSFLVLRIDVLSFPRTLTILPEDYRKVDGEWLPFKETQTYRVGIAESEVHHVQEIKFNVPISDSEFRPAK